MPVSYSSAVNTGLMELSPVRVTFKGVDLGGTHGNCKIFVETDKADIMADQFGKTVLDRRVSGHKYRVETELTQVQSKDNWKVVFPSQSLVTSGGNKLFLFSSQIGTADLSNAGALLLHPLSKSNADLSTDYNFDLAIADEKSEVTYGPGEQVKLKIIWNILPNTGLVPARFFTYGDPSVGLIAASAGSPVFTGAGNGTLTSISVFNGFTKTETITVKCVGASTGNDFFVSGSLSGALGEFHLAAASGSTTTFTSNQIAFTANQGTIQFAYNDMFTIATTAANYI